MTEPLSITRYNCTVGDCRGEFGDCMEKNRSGRWVTFEQHMRQVKHLQREIIRLTTKIKIDPVSVKLEDI